jgi:hypothetical protein
LEQWHEQSTSPFSTGEGKVSAIEESQPLSQVEEKATEKFLGRT